MPPVRRHCIGDQMPAVVHASPDPAALALCRDLMVETDVERVILYGSRVGGGWDEQSNLDVIFIHRDADNEDAKKDVRRVRTGQGTPLPATAWTPTRRSRIWA